VKVSVLVITYNHERYIAQAIESALAQQTSFDFEIVVGEDCSTDRTRAILLAYQQRYPDTIRLLLPEKNIGMHRNFVQTLHACAGEYVALLEGDDYWTSRHKLQKQVEFLERHPKCAICFHATALIYEDGSHPPGKYPGGHQKEISTIEDLLVRNFMQTCSVMFRRGLFDTFPDWFFTLKLGDWPLHVLNAQHGDIGYIDEVMSAYRLHLAGVWSTQNRAKHLQETIRVLRTLNRHLAYKYDRRVRTSISICYCGLAGFYEQRADLKQARANILRSLIEKPLNRDYFQAQVALLLKLYAPALYRPLRRAKRYLGRKIQPNTSLQESPSVPSAK